MKKFLISLLALLFSAGLFADAVLIDGLYYEFGNTTATVAKDPVSGRPTYSAYTTVTIPATVTYNNYTYPVVTIGTSAFENCSNLQSVTLPNSITAINQDAFYHCTKLGSVNLPEGLTYIGLRAFIKCNLTSVTIPSTVTSMGNYAFYDNPLTEVVWKPVTCAIGTGEYAPFYSTNSKITKFTFGDQVQTLPSYLCKNMNLLDTIVLPPSVKSLGQYAFAYCTKLKSINLPVTQKTLPVSFFEGCTALESIELPATLTTISTDAFYGCTSLKEINLHEGIETIYQRAFFNCKLTEITIPSTVSSLGAKAFQSNPLTSVTWLPASCSVSTGEDAPFYSTSSTITSFSFGDQVEIIPNYLCYKMSQLDTVVLPQNLKTIGNYAFAYCSALKGVEIPTSVTLLARNSFSYCPALKSFTFPEGLTTVATEVLEGCTALEEVFIPASVTTINSDAFYNCSGLMAIHNYAFTPQTINENTVKNVNKQTCILYVPMDYIDLYQEANVWKDFANIIGVATDLQFEDQIVNISYLKDDTTLHYMESQTWAVPHEPRIEGFTFIGWQVLPGMLEDGIVLQAVYEANTPTPTQAPAVYVNPANPTQKLIRHGNVYILRDDKIYTIQGQTVK